MIKKFRRNQLEIKEIGKVRFLWNEILDIINPIFIAGKFGEGKKESFDDFRKEKLKEKSK